MFEKSEIQIWAKSNSYGEKIFEIVCKEIKGTKSILKVILKIICLNCKTSILIKSIHILVIIYIH